MKYYGFVSKHASRRADTADARKLGHHIYHQFDQDLEGLRSKVLRTGGLVERQLRDALKALEEQDSELAETVISRDQEINNLELAIDEDSAPLLARRQPVAGDLRLLISIIKNINDLERMGDEAVRIARMALRHAERSGRSVPPRAGRTWGPTCAAWFTTLWMPLPASTWTRASRWCRRTKTWTGSTKASPES